MQLTAAVHVWHPGDDGLQLLKCRKNLSDAHSTLVIFSIPIWLQQVISLQNLLPFFLFAFIIYISSITKVS